MIGTPTGYDPTTGRLRQITTPDSNSRTAFFSQLQGLLKQAAARQQAGIAIDPSLMARINMFASGLGLASPFDPSGRLAQSGVGYHTDQYGTYDPSGRNSRDITGHFQYMSPNPRLGIPDVSKVSGGGGGTDTRQPYLPPPSGGPGAGPGAGPGGPVYGPTPTADLSDMPEGDRANALMSRYQAGMSLAGAMNAAGRGIPVGIDASTMAPLGVQATGGNMFGNNDLASLLAATRQKAPDFFQGNYRYGLNSLAPWDQLEAGLGNGYGQNQPDWSSMFGQNVQTMPLSFGGAMGSYGGGTDAIAQALAGSGYGYNDAMQGLFGGGAAGQQQTAPQDPFRQLKNMLGGQGYRALRQSAPAMNLPHLGALGGLRDALGEEKWQDFVGRMGGKDSEAFQGLKQRARQTRQGGQY